MKKLRRYIKLGLFVWLFICLFSPSVSVGKMLVGVIFSGNIPYYRSMHVAFLKELKQNEEVYNNLKFVVQFPAPDPVALSNTAKKLIVGGVDMIISYGYPATRAVLAKESDIPLVYVGVYDADSLIAKKGSVTGCGFRIPAGKLLPFIKEIVQVARLVVIYSPNEEDSIRQVNDVVNSAEENNINVVKLGLRSRSDVKKLKELRAGDAVFMTGSALVHVMIKNIMALMQENLVPVFDVIPDSTEEGILVTLHHDPFQQGLSAAGMIEKIVAGAEAGSIEPEMYTNTELVVNLAEAKNLGVSLPSQLMSEATKVIE